MPELLRKLVLFQRLFKKKGVFVYILSGGVFRV